MSAITSLLVRDQVVSVRKVEMALQKQVVDGGDLESVLLEMEAIEENVLNAYCAVIFGLLPGTRDEVMGAHRDVTRLVPRELAMRHRFVPLASDGKVMVVAVSEPFSVEARREIQGVVNQDLAYRVVTPVRLAAALAHHYGGDLDPKHRRLVEKLRNRAPGIVPYVAPPPMGGRVTSPTPVVGTPSQASPPRSTRPRGEYAFAPQGAPSQEAARNRRRVPSSVRGPLPSAEASKRLGEAGTRDEVLEIFLVFARQFLDYVALFVVQGDLAAGRDARGDGPDGDAVRRLAVPLDVPGVFATVRENHQPTLVDLRSSELDQIVMRDMDRQHAQPALLVPVVLRGRVIAFFYGDRSGESFDVSDVPEVVGLARHVADGLERLIVAKKEARASQAGTWTAPGAVSAPTVTHRDDPTEPEVRLPKADASSVTPAHAMPAGFASAPPPAITPSAKDRTLAYSSVRPPAPGPEGVVQATRSSPPPASSPGLHSMPSGLGGYSVRAPSADVVNAPATISRPPAAENAPPRASRPPSSDTVPSAPPVAAFQAAAAAVTVTSATSQSLPAVKTAPVIDVSGPATSTSSSSTPAVTPSRPPRRTSTRPDPRRDSDAPVHSDRVSVPDSRGSLSPTEREEPTAPNAEAMKRVSWRPEAHPSHRARPRSKDSEPTVIVNMGDQLEKLVLDLIGCGPEEEGAAVAMVLKTGEPVLPVLVQRFPGPLWFDRRQPHTRLPRGKDISAAARAIVAFKDLAVPYVCSLLDTRDSETRFYAVLLASEFPTVDVMQRVANHIYDKDAGTRKLAVATFRSFWSLGKPVDEALKPVRTAAKHSKGDLYHQVQAIGVLAEMRDRRSFHDLVELLGSKDLPAAQAAQTALVAIARQDFGTSAKRWVQWYDKNGERHRLEWLMDALLHSNEEIRRAAGDELKEFAQQSFGFAAMSSRRDREISQQKYRDWWLKEGHQRFSRSFGEAPLQ